MLNIIYNIRTFFTQGSERSIKAKQNIIISFIIKGISIVTSLILVPLTLGYVNSTQYGIWLTVSSILSWFTFFDMGFTHGFRNKCAEALAINDQKLAKSYISTTYIAFVLIFTCVYIVFFIANRFLDWSYILGLPNDINTEVRLVFDVVAFFFCFQLILGVINGLLLADQKPAFSSFLATLGQLIILLVIFVLTKITDGSLLTLALVMSSIPVIVLIIASILLFSNKYFALKPSFDYIRKDLIRDIVSLGGKFFVIQIASIFVFQSLNIIISHTQGPEQVTIYNISYKCFNTFNMLFVIILSPFWSAFTDAFKKDDYVWMSRVYSKLVKISILFSFVILAFLLLSEQVYHLWLKDSVHIPFMTSLGMALYICLTTIGCVPVTLLNGMGKVKIQMYIQIFFAFITIPSLLVILNNFDLFWGLLFICLNPIVHIILCSKQIKMLLSKQANTIWNE